MFKVFASATLAIAAAALPLATPAAAAGTVGPYAASCDGSGPAVIARVGGLKANTGVIRVQLYASNANFLEKKQYLRRVDVPARASTMNICVPVAKAGRYVISVRHDVNGNGKSDRSDGGGFSGNPDVSLMDLMAKRKPALARVSFSVGSSPQVIPVTLRYVQGLSFKPIAA